MGTTLKSREELIDIYRTEAQGINDKLTDFSEGSINDALAGAAATVGVEVSELTIEDFRKTFFGTANGPEITEGADELENLATDHFGDDFDRPDIQLAVGVETFTRPTSAFGDVVITKDTIVKSLPDANGDEQRFKTIAAVSMIVGGATELSVNASVEAFVGGTKGNVEAGTVKVIESTLLDSTIVAINNDDFSAGAPEENDALYRDTIKRKILALKGATKSAIESTALNVAGVEQATAREFIQTVIEFNESLQLPVVGAVAFKIPRTKLFIADANGTASQALIDNVDASVFAIRACGVRIDVLPATPIILDWASSFTLNPSGPNFAALSVDAQPILDVMEVFIETLDIGDDFIRVDAGNAILAIFGPAGSNDLVSFSTISPTGDVITTEVERLLPGIMSKV